MEWREYKLSQVATLTTGYPFDGHKYDKEGIRVVRGDNVTIGKLRWDTDKDKRWNEQFDRASEYSLSADDIVIGMDGSRVGKNRAQVKQEDLPLFIAQRVACVRNNSLSEQAFLYYQIFSDRFENYIKSVQTGTSIPHVSLKQIGDFPILLPSTEVQRKIASILKSLDDKIENNRKINENLEQQAQVLFKSWFVDFEPFRDQPFVESELGMIPEGWRVGTIGDYCKIRSGFAFKSSWWTESGCKVIKIKNISDNGELDLNDCSFVNPDNTKKANEFKATAGDLIIAMTGATIGKFNIIPKIKEDYFINQRVGKFFLGDKPLSRLPFIYCILKRKNTLNVIINKGQGSAQPNISGSDIENIPLVVPPVQVIDNFNTVLSPLFDMIISNQGENQSLSQLRDTLLPKLMSGELKI